MVIQHGVPADRLDVGAFLQQVRFDRLDARGLEVRARRRHGDRATRDAPEAAASRTAEWGQASALVVAKKRGTLSTSGLEPKKCDGKTKSDLGKSKHEQGKTEHGQEETKRDHGETELQKN